MEWILVLTLFFSEGIAREPLMIEGENSYTNEEDCKAIGLQLSSWLTQDFVKVEFRCHPVLQQASIKE